jgi:hypothetical protein
VKKIYSDFIEARADHIIFGNGGVYLAEAGRRMMSDPDYEERLYVATVFASERIIAACRR